MRYKDMIYLKISKDMIYKYMTCKDMIYEDIMCKYIIWKDG